VLSFANVTQGSSNPESWGSSRLRDYAMFEIGRIARQPIEVLDREAALALRLFGQ
jgi:hypothetical protein